MIRRTWKTGLFIAWSVGLVFPGSTAIADDSSTLIDVAATQNGDAWNSLQSSIDRAAKNGGTVRLAAGVYSVSQPIVLRPGTTIVGAGMERTTIRNLGRFPSPLIQIGMKEESSNVTLQDFCVEQRDNDLKNTHCIFGDNANDVRMTRIRVKGSRIEGIIGGAHARRWTLDSCEADGCGAAGPTFGRMSGAGINVTSRDVVLMRCKTVRCGQGFEFGNLNVHLLYCSAEQPNGAGPSIAFNCGSAVVGVSKVHLFRCSSAGYPSALIVGNGIGRMSGLVVDGCTFVDGSISFAGGKPKNSVVTPDQGPDVSGSYIRDCVIRWTKPSDQASASMLYATGIKAEDRVLGREPLIVQRLRVEFTAKPTGKVSTPVLGIAGHVSAPVIFRDCVVEGLDEAPIRGDGAVFGVLDNQLPDDIDHIRFINCTAKTPSGVAREFILKTPPKPSAKKPSSKKTKKGE